MERTFFGEWLYITSVVHNNISWRMGLDVAALRKSLNHGNGDVSEVRNASPYFHEQNTGFPWISHHYHEPILIPCYMFLAQMTILIKSEVLQTMGSAQETTTLLWDVFFCLTAVIQRPATGTQERLPVYILRPSLLEAWPTSLRTISKWHAICSAASLERRSLLQRAHSNSCLNLLRRKCCPTATWSTPP